MWLFLLRTSRLARQIISKQEIINYSPSDRKRNLCKTAIFLTTLFTIYSVCVVYGYTCTRLTLSQMMSCAKFSPMDRHGRQYDYFYQSKTFIGWNITAHCITRWNLSINTKNTKNGRLVVIVTALKECTHCLSSHIWMSSIHVWQITSH